MNKLSMPPNKRSSQKMQVVKTTDPSGKNKACSSEKIKPCLKREESPLTGKEQHLILSWINPFV